MPQGRAPTTAQKRAQQIQTQAQKRAQQIQTQTQIQISIPKLHVETKQEYKTV